MGGATKVKKRRTYAYPSGRASVGGNHREERGGEGDGEIVSILGGKRKGEETDVDTRNTTVPRVLEILESKTTVLRVRLLTLEGVLGPNTGGVEELGLPRLDVTEEVGNEAGEERHRQYEERRGREGSGRRKGEKRTNISEFPPPIPARK